MACHGACLTPTEPMSVCTTHAEEKKKKRPIIHSIPATSYVTGIIGWGWQCHTLGCCGHQLPWLPITCFQWALTQTVCVLPQLGSCVSDKDKEKKTKKQFPFIYRVYIDLLQTRRQKAKEQRQLFLWSVSVMLQMLEWHRVTKACLASSVLSVLQVRPLMGIFSCLAGIEGTIHCYFQKWNITGVYIRENDHLDTTKTGYAMFEAMLAVAIPLMLRHNNINNVWQRLSWGTCGGFCGLNTMPTSLSLVCLKLIWPDYQTEWKISWMAVLLMDKLRYRRLCGAVHVNIRIHNFGVHVSFILCYGQSHLKGPNFLDGQDYSPDDQPLESLDN